MAGLEITERDGIGVMIGARSVPDARAAGAAEKEVGGVAAVAGILPHLRFRFALDADLLGGDTDLRGKSATAARLALATVTDRQADRVAGAGDGDLARAAWCGGTGRAQGGSHGPTGEG